MKIDLYQNQYKEFISVFATKGINWVSYFQNDKGSGFNSLISLTGIYSLYNNSNESLRQILKNYFPLYTDDFVKIEIKKNNKIVFQDLCSIKNIKIFSAQLDLWKNESVNIKLLLEEKGQTRLDAEEKSLIFKTEEYLSKFDFVNKSIESINKIEEMSLKKERKLLNLSSISFNKVTSYENFIKFLSLSKYSNDFLINLDNSFKFEDQESQRLIDTLNNKEFL